ncbi:hypothetical protein [Dyella lutea]|uniref:DNA polymerase n=1 Tax=Dyella lutea TaxID=2950441 RepID=A0ABT1F856_9GAMM|nr:hypothetical protein [Dyella lutea]MCP1373553.1 hypothetical protein [Dyella lutea]
MLDARRQQVLQAMGITPWVRRVRESGAPAEEPMLDAPAVEPPVARCIVVLPAQLPPRTMDVLGRALQAAGAGIARAGRVLVADGQTQASVPHAPAYLVFGQAQAHALGRELPAAVMSQAHIALVDAPEALFAGAEGKRRLWAALRQLRRALAVAGAG